MKNGYIQIYTGDGKGKTTAALGLALRAAGRGLKVIMFQFLKGTFTGELESAKKLAPNFEICRFGECKKFFWKLTKNEKSDLKQNISTAYKQINNLLEQGEYDIVILDEIMGAIHNNLITEEEVCSLMDNKSQNTELILTGRDAPPKIIDKADLVTEMRPVKHYIDKGIYAREGIEK